VPRIPLSKFCQSSIKQSFTSQIISSPVNSSQNSKQNLGSHLSLDAVANIQAAAGQSRAETANTSNQVASDRSQLFLTYILQIFKQVKLIVKDQSDIRNLPMLVTLIQDRAPACKIHLLTWQLSNRRVYDLI
jgi:hypothetical protein